MKSYFASAARALATSFNNVFRKPVTVEFPKVIRPRAERYRASFALLHDEDGDEACIGCLQCERICPSQVISIKVGGKRESPVTGKKRGYADDFVLDLNACIYCELCVQVCPTDAIVMTREPELPAYGREDLVLTMAKLYANEKAKNRAWGDATRLNAMQTPPKPPKAAAPAVAAAPATSAAKPAAAPVAPAAAAPAASATSPSGAPGDGTVGAAPSRPAPSPASAPAASSEAAAVTGPPGPSGSPAAATPIRSAEPEGVAAPSGNAPAAGPAAPADSTPTGTSGEGTQ